MITALEAREKAELVEKDRIMGIIEKYVTQASSRGEYYVIIEEIYYPISNLITKELKEKGFTLGSYKKTSQYEPNGGIDVLKISW